MGLGQSPFDLPIMMFFGAPVLFWLLQRAEGTRAAAMLGWLAGTAYFALVLNWIVEPFLVDVGRHGWMAPFALIFMAAGLALFWAAAFGLAWRLTQPGWGRLIALAVFWAMAEWLRGHILTGFPWALPGYAWVGTPIVQLAAFIGPYGLTLLTLLVILMPALGRTPAAVAFIILALAWGFGILRVPAPVAYAAGAPVVRIVQPNAPQHLKWRADMIPIFVERMMDATRAPGRRDIVIWPETAVPFLYGESPDAVAGMVAAAGRGAHVIYGLRRISADGLWHNSLSVATSQGDIALYDKVHLVPFGEYMPFARLFARFGIFGLAAEDVAGFSPGKTLAPVEAEGLPPFLPLICYEAVFPEEVNAGRGAARWMVHLTNDAWFGAQTGPFQHLAQARMRAIEQGMPVARSANTGVSAMIDPYGRVLAQIPLGTHGHIDARLPSAVPPTPYVQWGEWIFAALIWLSIGLAIAARRLSL